MAAPPGGDSASNPRTRGTSFASTLEDAAEDLDEERALAEDFDDDGDDYADLEDLLDDVEVSFDD